MDDNLVANDLLNNLVDNNCVENNPFDNNTFNCSSSSNNDIPLAGSNDNKVKRSSSMSSNVSFKTKTQKIITLLSIWELINYFYINVKNAISSDVCALHHSSYSYAVQLNQR